MRRTRAGTLTATLILGGVLVATAPMITAPSSLAAAHREAAGDEDRQLRIGVTTFGPETWDPILGDATTANAMHGHVFDWLVRLEHGRPAPGVLESFEMSADGSYWDLRLRSGLTFHDGSPATVDDLEFTIERYMSEEAIRAHMRDSVERTEVIDDLTLRVFLKEPNPYFPYYLSNTVPNQGSLMPKAYIEEHGLDYFLANPIGVGPYRLESQTVGVSHTYRAVEDHWRITPAFDTLTVSLVPELDTQLALLETGDLDLVYVALDDVERLEGEGYRTLSLFAPATRIDLVASYDPRVVGMPTEDIRVREALARAIDYEAIEESLFHGRSLPRVPPRALFEMDEVDPEWSTYIEEELQSYDPERALALLEEAGYPDGFEIDLFVSQPAGIDYMNDLAETVQAYWSQVGVTANITNLELAEYNAVRGPVDRIVGSALFASTGVYGPAPLNMSWIWGSAGGQPIHAHLQEDGTLDVFLPELDELMYGAIAELDPERRLELIDETIRMGLDTYTSIVFGQVPTTIAVAPGIDFLDLKEPLTSSSTPPIAEFVIPANDTPDSVGPELTAVKEPGTVVVGVEGPVVFITLDRPDKLNAINEATRGSLVASVRAANDDSDVRVIVLRGAGERAFCAGADVAEFSGGGSLHEIREARKTSVWYRELAASRKPTIASIHGYCLGGGLEMALACDLRIAAHDAVFGLPEVTMGIIPGAGGTQRITRLLGQARALELILTGERIDAARAGEIGLVNRVVPRDKLGAATLALAGKVAASAPIAVAYAKEAVQRGAEMTFAEGLRLESDLATLLTASDDRAEGIASFNEKRKPHYRGT